jgi:hypothetical protein
MAKIIYLFITIFCTLFFFNYKISKSARVIAFQEEETPKEAICSFVGMVIIAILWTFYFAIF